MTDRKKDWAICERCGHRINPDAQVCDEAWQHLPCSYDGCVPQKVDTEPDV